jgi:flagellar basal-body rod modification protein FlgD
MSNTISNAVNGALGKDDFLKLLTTELRNQDPLSPMDNKDFISQMAQFSSLEQTNNVAKSIETLNSNFSMLFQHSLLSQGAALIGKQVSGMETTGESVIEGIVESVMWLDGNPQLQLRMSDGSLKGMEMNEIISVSEAHTNSTTTPEPSTQSTSSDGPSSGTETQA